MALTHYKVLINKVTLSLCSSMRKKGETGRVKEGKREVGREEEEGRERFQSIMTLIHYHHHKISRIHCDGTKLRQTYKHAKLLQSCPTLCDPMDCSLPGSSVHGILQARILEWVAIPISRGSSLPRDQAWVSCIVGRFFHLIVKR